MKSLLFFTLFGMSSLSLADGLSKTDRVPTSAKKILGCTSFTGNWEGTCVTDEATLSGSLTISQDECASIDLDGAEYPFGVDLVAEEESARYSQRLDWDASYKVISVSAKLESKSPEAPASEFKTDVSVNGTMEIVNQVLVSKITNTFSPRDGETPSATTEICRYKRK